MPRRRKTMCWWRRGCPLPVLGSRAVVARSRSRAVRQDELDEPRWRRRDAKAGQDVDQRRLVQPVVTSLSKQVEVVGLHVLHVERVVPVAQVHIEAGGRLDGIKRKTSWPSSAWRMADPSAVTWAICNCAIMTARSWVPSTQS